MNREELKKILAAQFEKIQFIAALLIGFVFVYIGLAIGIVLYFKPAEMDITPSFFTHLRLFFYILSALLIPLLIKLEQQLFNSERLLSMTIPLVFQRYTTFTFIRLGVTELPALFAIIWLLFTAGWIDFALLTAWSLFWQFRFFPRFAHFCRLVGLD